ncbi:TIR domain-containing protein [Chloroflexota bacterium]
MEIESKVIKALEIVESQKSELSDLFDSTSQGLDIHVAAEKIKRWKNRTVRLLSEHVHSNEGNKLRDIKRNWSSSLKDGFKYDVTVYSAFLSSLGDELRYYPAGIILAELNKDTTIVSKEEPNFSDSRTVFIVHGHDDRIKQLTARFLEKLDLKPLILHEQADKGKTIIEKLEASASEIDVGYAVVLLTPDDLGADASEKDKLQPRARQNVAFELGYFIAKLGRERVRALYSEGVELPSDYQGVLYTKIDPAGAWQMELAREIKAAGIQIDLNKLVY